MGAKNVTFFPDLPGVTFTKYNMAPKRRTISKIGLSKRVYYAAVTPPGFAHEPKYVTF